MIIINRKREFFKVRDVIFRIKSYIIIRIKIAQEMINKYRLEL